MSLPFLHLKHIPLIDHLFVAVSALSTTGLSTVNIAQSYNLGGQILLLVLIQIGGIGYMSIGSFITLIRKNQINLEERNLLKNDFSLPNNFNLATFIKSLILFSLLFELLGAIGLSVIFYQNGEVQWLWKGIFHSISAYCTAGFSLFDDSFIQYQNHLGLNVIISILSIAGALGFIVFTDFYDRIRGRKSRMTFTSKIILRVTFTGILIGTFVLAFTSNQSILLAVFQSMTAFTTVGFNSMALGDLSHAALFFMIILMTIGASPAGTGGGVKSTTITALFAQLRCTLRNRKDATFLGRSIPAYRIKAAMSNFFIYVILILLGTFFLLLVQSQAVFDVLFEVISALGTVGLSLGLTSELTLLGKLIIIVLMLLGRIGPLSVGIALFRSDKKEEEHREVDIIL